MQRPMFRRVALGATIATLMIIPAAPAFAHGDAHQGDLEMTIGFAQEPAFAGFPNAVQLTLVHDGEPVTDLKPGDLSVEITFGDETSESLVLEPSFAFEDGRLEFGEPGEYRADFIPSQPGDYTFHFAGTVDGEEVDQEMSSGPSTFSSVEPTSDVSFPAVDAPTNEELASRIDQEAARTDEAVTAAQDSATSAEDAASGARTLGIIGVVLGTVGIIAAIAALAATRRKG